MTKTVFAGIIARLGGIAIASIIFLLVIAEVLGLHNSVTATWELAPQYITDIVSLMQAALLAGVAATSLFLAVSIGKRGTSFPPRQFLCVAIGGGVILHVILALCVEPQWSTDYLRYWQHAQDLVKQGRYGGSGGIYDSRALLVPYIVVRIFGPDATFALKLVNIALLGACQLFAYDILRRVSSHKTAQIAVALLVAAPLPAYATLIPSHDLWGMFFLSGALWVFSLGLFPTTDSPPKPSRWASLALLAGIVAYLAELQRSTGLVFCAALLVASFLGLMMVLHPNSGAENRHRAVITIMASILCFAGMTAAKKVGRELGLSSPPGTSLFMMKVAANSGGMGSGTSDWYIRFKDRFGIKQSSESEAVDFAKSVGLSSWALQPLERTAHLADQARRLFELNYPMDWDVLMRRPKGMSSHARQAFILYADFYGIAFGVLLVYALMRLASSNQPPPFPILVALLSVLVLAFTLLTLFENKPFNIFPVWFAASLTIAHVFTPNPSPSPNGAENAPPTPQPLRLRPLFEGGVLVAAFAIAGFMVLRANYGMPEGRLLNAWALHNHQAKPVRGNWEKALLDARPEAFDPASYDPKTIKKTFVRNSVHDAERIQKYAGDTFVRLQFPGVVSRGDHLSMTTRVCNNGGERKSVEYFLFSPKRRGLSGGSFALSVTIDGKKIRRDHLPFKGRNFRRFVLGDVLSDGACHMLGFRLEAPKLTGTVPAHRTPFVEVWMPRLIP